MGAPLVDGDEYRIERFIFDHVLNSESDANTLYFYSRKTYCKLLDNIAFISDGHLRPIMNRLKSRAKLHFPHEQKEQCSQMPRQKQKKPRYKPLPLQDAYPQIRSLADVRYRMNESGFLPKCPRGGYYKFHKRSICCSENCQTIGCSHKDCGMCDVFLRIAGDSQPFEWRVKDGSQNTHGKSMFVRYV